jgi:hypothetical protein
MKIAVVASGWHYPSQFYEMMAKQKGNHQVDLFCVSHRDPSFATHPEFPDSLRGSLDKRLYEHPLTKEDIIKLGWNYKEYPNTVGDWGNTNQWLEDHNYQDYDLLLFTHDDNLILTDELFTGILADESYSQWDILTNSIGVPAGSIRGSFEFFKPGVLTLMGGKFDLSPLTLTREGKTDNPDDLLTLNDWNGIVAPLNKIILDNNLSVMTLSPAYRVSAYCIEGERGFIHRTHGSNTLLEDAGLMFLKDNGII